MMKTHERGWAVEWAVGRALDTWGRSGVAF